MHGFGMKELFMIGTFDINFEKELIKGDAEQAYEDCIYMAESKNLEKDFVFQEFINQFHALVRKNKIM